MRALEPWHLIVLVLVIAVLFGSKRLPDAARGLGRSMRIFKAEVKEMKEEDRRTASSPSASDPDAVPAPLEGRIVNADPSRVGTPSEQSRDA